MDMIIVYSYNSLKRGDRVEIVILLLYVLIGYFIASVTHELGHIFVGLLQGFKFYLLVIGPVGLKKEKTRQLKFYFERNAAFWGGVGGTYPKDITDTEENLNKFGRILIGGPIFSIFFSVIWILIGIFTKSRFPIVVGAMSLGIGIACLIPMRSGAFYTDGGRWHRIHKAETRKIEAAMINIEFSSLRYNDYSRANMDDIQLLLNDKDRIMNYMGYIFICRHYRDVGDVVSFEKNKEKLSLVGDRIPKQIKSVINLDD